ncbi:MAG: zinc-binding alcohol dehydrogenase [Candidatus Poribacteria bacterium]|nr:zinc-binding alcohol dehydrogenase [Candidatus Poribacteria bacterium]
MANQQGWRVVVRPDNTAETEPFDVPEARPGHVLIRAEYAAISAGTELGTQEQKRGGDVHPGYSNVGKVIALGEGVSHVKVGDRVLTAGNHASHVVAAVGHAYFQRVPEGLSLKRAAFGVLGMVAMHGARKARVEWGEHVVVVGAGMIGQLTLRLLATCGAETLTAIDLSDFRLDKARLGGATHALNPAKADVRGELDRITKGRGVDVVVEASGFPEVLPAMFDALRVGGRCVLLGSIWHRKVELDLMPFHEKELTLVGAHQPKAADRSTALTPWSRDYNGQSFLERLGDGRLDLDPLITHVLPATDAGYAYRQLRDARDEALGVLFDFTDR